MTTKMISSALLTVCTTLAATTSQAADFDTFRKAAADGETKLNFRYRYEYVDQEGIDKDAGASTLLARLTWNSGAISGWKVGVEADYIALIGGENYNSTANGETDYPVVADPEGFDLNQAFIKYSGDKLTATGGRQRIVHLDQRFLGGVAWRQNEQTYDGLRAQYKPNDKLSLDYSYVMNVNRIFGPQDGAQPSDWRSNSHFGLAKYALAKGHSIEGFAYLLDFDNDNGVPNSTSTFGLSYHGAFGPLKVEGTYATQSDYGDSPLDYDADFYRFAVSAKFNPVTITAGYEVLGSDDGVAAFRTPLATLHKFQGFADKFLGTPANGIEDLYLGIAGTLGKAKIALTYHDFKANEGSSNYGDEINLVATYPVTDGFKVQLKAADYSADEFATDTTKVWFSMIVAF